MVSVSRGKLGCENCRSRRIKCNQLRPRCSQCARAGLQCSGYRTVLDLVFQDQTARIAQKYHGTDITLHGKDRHHNITFFVPPMPMEEIALQHYLDQFNITQGPSPLRAQERPKIIVTSVISVGLAALAAAHRDPQLMQLARGKYATALRLLARAIHGPEQSPAAYMATSSFNLSMFEMIMYDNRSDSYQWLKHIYGMTAVLSSGGLAGMNRTQMTAVLQVCYTVAIACIISRQRVPSFLVDLVQSAEKANSEPPVELFPLLCSLVDLYVQTNQSQSQKRSHVTSKALEIVRSLQCWLARLPSPWTDPVNTVQSQREPDGCWIARVWIYYRLCRILAHIVIQSSLASPLQSISWALGDVSLAQSDSLSPVLCQMTSEIYDCIPSMLGSIYLRDKPSPYLSSNVFFLITILQALIKLTDKTSVVNNWSSRMCKLYGEDFGVMKELVMMRLC
ncbi:hypothetical protein CNMCM6805_006949 [Aspergillus fumigatiaffinis]|uniref:Zn(2)-C6 fungal-type domain-containing protein n=1 Tax=Aspergillus fumigatiaffinis TaxID=340414 RepID=A0A8H4MCU6_9EURO|nr:hypothetical protein CNMCM6805_006949 [Aspergillus fumigatiaffinis]KAF4237938.1 hypothetical protein CNMCM6457_000415 [Aspergillus fumigatiaffinis]